jgi:hypothetical protein
MGPCPSNIYLAINAFIFTQNLAATYRFGCRMSNKKVSPQLATLDGQVFVSSALHRDYLHAYKMKKRTDGRIRCLAITGL